MRMFQSVSGHSSEQSIAHYSSRSTVSQLKGVCDTISNWFDNRQPHKTQISTVTNAPFIQNSFRMAPNVPMYVDRNRKFSEGIFQLPQYSRQRSDFFSLQGCSRKTDLTFPAFSLRFKDFTAQVCFGCKFSVTLCCFCCNFSVTL